MCLFSRGYTNIERHGAVCERYSLTRIMGVLGAIGGVLRLLRRSVSVQISLQMC